MSGIFQKLIEVGIVVGTISNAHLYDSDFINIEGVTFEGKKFSLTLNIMEEEKEND